MKREYVIPFVEEVIFSPDGYLCSPSKTNLDKIDVPESGMPDDAPARSLYV